MSVALRCAVCLDSLQEGDPTHIPHTDGTPAGRRHIGDGIHPTCLEAWIFERYVSDLPITCPLGCLDKLIEPGWIVSEEELQNRRPRRLINRLRNWIYARLEPPINRQILGGAGVAGATTAAVAQIAVNGMNFLVRSAAGQWIPSSVVFVPGTGLSFAIGTIMGGAAAYALSGQGRMGLEQRGIHGLSVTTAVVSSILGIVAAQALLHYTKMN